MKVLFVPQPLTTWDEIRIKLGGDGIVPWWTPLGIVGVFVTIAGALILFGPRVTTYDLDQWRFEADEAVRPRPDADI